MIGSFTIQLIDILVYLIPGGLVFGVIIFCIMPSAIAPDCDNNKVHLWIRLFAIFCLSYVTGILIFKFSKIVLHLYIMINDQGLFINIVNAFHDADFVKERLEKKFKIISKDSLDLYDYSKLIVLKLSPSNSSMAERYWGMSLLCRNLLVAIPTVYMLIFKKYFNKSKMFYLSSSLYMLVMIFILFLVYKSYVSYTTSSVWAIFRALIIVSYN